jgi:arylsulfatase A-like enzyme
VEENAAGKQGKYLTDVLLGEALTFLQKHKSGEPFLLIIVYPAPPLSDAIPALEEYAGKDWPRFRKLRAARVAEFDRAVGIVMNELQTLRLANRTALMVTSTCGPAPEEDEDVAFFNLARQIDGRELPRLVVEDKDTSFFHSRGGLRGQRGELYEAGIRVPFVARLPGLFMPGITRDYAAAVWDLLPTLADLCGAVNVPRRLDGMSIAPMLRGGIGEARKMLYWEVSRRGFGQAVRMGDWKVVRLPGETRREDCELYNLKKDPKEQKDVSSRHPDIVAKFLK